MYGESAFGPHRGGLKASVTRAAGGITNAPAQSEQAAAVRMRQGRFPLKNHIQLVLRATSGGPAG